MDSCNKKRKRDKASSPTKAKTSPHRMRSQDVEAEELKAVDEAFHLSRETVTEILDLICSGETTLIYHNSDKYATLFFRKTLACSTSYNEPEETSSEEMSSEEDEDMESTHSLTESDKEEVMESTHASTEDKSSEEGEVMESTHALTEDTSSEEDDDDDVVCGLVRPMLVGPFDFGSYSPGYEPRHIPYHLYLLVKEAVDIMKPFGWCNNPDDVTKLKTVENKIQFFCNYFHSHLPTDWRYTRNHASTLLANYDPPLQLRYNMACYTPISIDEFNDFEFDEDSDLPREELLNIMRIVHSRKTPAYWKMPTGWVLFYCKLCSCFGIDYHRLEAASEDDVCLMIVGRSD